MITFNEYQENTKLTAKYPKNKALEYVILGLVGESAEIANKYKKVIRDNDGVLTEERRNQIIDEIGDVMWYVSQLCNELGVNLETLCEKNINKLLDRKERGVIKGDGDIR